MHTYTHVHLKLTQLVNQQQFNLKKFKDVSQLKPESFLQHLPALPSTFSLPYSVCSRHTHHFTVPLTHEVWCCLRAFAQLCLKSSSSKWYMVRSFNLPSLSVSA